MREMREIEDKPKMDLGTHLDMKGVTDLGVK